MELKDVAQYHAEQAKEAEACGEKKQAKMHYQMMNAIIEEMED
jgi:hypothetical protein